MKFDQFKDSTLPIPVEEPTMNQKMPLEAQYSSRELNYLLDKDYFETDDEPDAGAQIDEEAIAK